MFFEKKARFLNRITVRLSLWYTGLTAALFVVAFVACYLMVSRSVSHRTDEDLLEEYRELRKIAESGDLESIKEGIQREGELDGVENLFVRLMSDDGELITSSDLSHWRHLDEVQVGADMPGPFPQLRTVHLPGRPFAVRILFAEFGKGNILQIGMSLEKDQRLTGKLRTVSVITMIAVFPGGALLGWLMSRRVLSGVEIVRKTALQISEGNLRSRVLVKGTGDEIDQLAETFNSMVMRIERLIQEMKEVTDNIAHDLRTPVARIRGLAEATLTQGESGEVYEATLGMIIEECDRLLGIINTLLDLSELHAGITELNTEVIQIAELVEDIGEMFVAAAEEKGINLRLDNQDVGTVKGDRRGLQRAVANLIDNALKYTPSRGSVTVSTCREEDNACVAVTDSGCGISESQLPHIFDRFYRGDRSRAEPGSGLGLSLTKALIEAHGGKIRVASTVDKGSTFLFTLPLLQQKHPS